MKKRLRQKKLHRLFVRLIEAGPDLFEEIILDTYKPQQSLANRHIKAFHLKPYDEDVYLSFHISRHGNVIMRRNTPDIAEYQELKGE